MIALLLAAMLAPDVPAADPFVGRWNVRITDAENTFVSGGFDVARKDGVLQASIVWRSGSFLPARRAEVQDGILRMVRDAAGGKSDVFEARVSGDGLLGVVRYADGRTHQFEGRRAPSLERAGPVRWGKPVKLFDGKSLEGFRLRNPKAKMGWAVVDGDLAVVAPEGNADLVTERTFQDLKLHLEWNVDPKGNSGVYLRGRYEVQIEDDPTLATNSLGTGAVYSRIAPAMAAAKGPGEWQVFDITFVGRRLTVMLNGKTILDDVRVEGITGGALSPFEDEPGPLMLQGDHGKVRFRNIVVTPAE